MFDWNKTRVGVSGSWTVTANEPDVEITGNSTSNTGGNFTIEYTGNGQKSEFSFRREQVGNWYDDDFTDAEFGIAIHPGIDRTSLSYNSGSWRYYRPYSSSVYSLYIRFKKAVNSSPSVTSIGTGGDTTSSPITSVIQHNTISGPWNGTKTIKLIIEASSTNRMNGFVYEDDVLITEFTSDVPYDASGSVSFHHHNYNNTSTERLLGISHTSNAYITEGKVLIKGDGVRRLVGLYNRDTMELISKTYTDSNGYYKLVSPNDVPAFVVVLEDETIQRYASQVRDFQTLTLEAI